MDAWATSNVTLFFTGLSLFDYDFKAGLNQDTNHKKTNTIHHKIGLANDAFKRKQKPIEVVEINEEKKKIVK